MLTTDEIKEKITKIPPNKYKLTRKKNKTFIKDGIFNYQIKLLKCSCEKNFCMHLLFYFYYILKLDMWEIWLLQDKTINTNIIPIKNINNIKKQIKIDSEIIFSDMCGICCESLFNDFNLHKCIHCHKYTHNICLHRWLTKKSNKGKILPCIYCKC